MSPNTKVIVGLLSFLPILSLLFFIPTIINLIPQFIEWDRYEPDAEEVFRTLGPLLIWIIVAGLISLGLLVFFIIHLINNKTIESGEKVVWIFVFLFVSMVGYPIYWYLRIWKEQPAGV